MIQFLRRYLVDCATTELIFHGGHFAVFPPLSQRPANEGFQQRHPGGGVKTSEESLHLLHVDDLRFGRRLRRTITSPFLDGAPLVQIAVSPVFRHAFGDVEKEIVIGPHGERHFLEIQPARQHPVILGAIVGDHRLKQQGVVHHLTVYREGEKGGGFSVGPPPYAVFLQPTEVKDSSESDALRWQC